MGGSPDPRFGFPDPRAAPAGMPLAQGGDLSTERLVAAYSQGIFPWYCHGKPVLWWCPDPRLVLFPDEYRCPHGLRRSIRDTAWMVTSDEAFDAVIKSCADTPRPGQDGTWITEDMIEAYSILHRTGYAHSVECWRDGELAGGLYGVAVGGVFFGESMFFHHPNASKVAFHHLVRQLARWDFTLVDCQVETSHLTRFGARLISRDRFLDLVEKAVTAPPTPSRWRIAEN
jgi:leucyl/phenylalanyl-tRNA--protein transferase